MAGCLTFVPISCMGPKHATKDKHLILQPVFMDGARACSSILDILELQKQVPQHLPESHGALVFEIHPHFLNGT